MGRLADDWVVTRDLLVDVGLADQAHIVYFGLSMATRFGLATAVALGSTRGAPHVGAFTPFLWPRLEELIRRQLTRFATGEELDNVVAR